MTQILTIALLLVSAATATLLVAAAASLRGQGVFSLSSFRNKDPAFADLLTYGHLIDEHVILCKNGSFLTGWSYTGDDNSSESPARQERVSQVINNAISALGSGYMLHISSIRTHTPEYSSPNLSHFPDPITRAIDAERRDFFQQKAAYQSIYHLFITWLPSAIHTSKFRPLLFKENPGAPLAHADKLLDEFHSQMNRFEHAIGEALTLSRLGSEQLLNPDATTTQYNNLVSAIAGNLSTEDTQIQIPSTPCFLDSIVGSQEFIPGNTPKLGPNHLAMIAIDGFPAASTPGMLELLSLVPITCRWTTRYICLDQHQALARLNAFRKKWRQKVRSFTDQLLQTQKSPINRDALEMVEETEQAIAEVSSDRVSAGYYTATITLMSPHLDELDSAAQQIQDLIGRLGFASRREKLNATEAFLGSLPGHGVENVRRPVVTSMNLADLIPTSTPWRGETTAPCPMYPPSSPPLMTCLTTGATPFNVNLHVRDLGHTLIFGPTGSGKSTLLALIVAQFRRYKRAKIFAFDKGWSLYPLTLAARGTHYHLTPDAIGANQAQFAPLQHLKPPPLGRQDDHPSLTWTANWLMTILELNNIQPTAAISAHLQDTLKIMSQYTAQAPSFSDLITQVQNQEVRQIFQQYAKGGRAAHLFDAPNDSFKDGHTLATIEVGELLAQPARISIPTLLYLFNRIEEELTGDPALIVLDEAWIMLANPEFQAKIAEWLKTLRKHNCAVILATQSLSDVMRSDILDIVIESTATKIFLPNIYADEERTGQLYEQLGLNAAERTLVATATPKQHYYYLSPEGRRIFDLALGPIALSFVGASDRESLRSIKNLATKYAHNWPEHWLNQRGITL